MLYSQVSRDELPIATKVHIQIFPLREINRIHTITEMTGKPPAKRNTQDGQLSETREAMKSIYPTYTLHYVFYNMVLLAVREISRLLKTGLDDNSLRICVQLCEAGVNPEALATVIQELRREAAALKVSYTNYFNTPCVLGN